MHTIRTFLFLVFLRLALVGQSSAKDLVVTTDQKPQPVKVTVTITLPAEAMDTVEHADLFPQAAPAKVIWQWGDQKADRLFAYDEFDWKAGQKSATATHVYEKVGDYGIVVTILDAKKRLIVQRSASFEINPPILIKK